MKKIQSFLFAAMLIIYLPVYAQVGIGTATPAASAMLDLSSTTSGFLLPRMNYYQRTQIVSPAVGLTIWCSNCGLTGQIQVYNGNTWTLINGAASDSIPTLTIGANYKGGKVAYILVNGDPGYDPNTPHGLIAATSDQSGWCQWGCFQTNFPGAHGSALGTGNQNTIDIMAGCVTAGIAARLCGDLVINKCYDDWYLPSKDELNKLYINRVAIGNFAVDDYWSSTTDNTLFMYAWTQYFGSGAVYNTLRYNNYRVRAVRNF